MSVWRMKVFSRDGLHAGVSGKPGQIGEKMFLGAPQDICRLRRLLSQRRQPRSHNHRHYGPALHRGQSYIKSMALFLGYIDVVEVCGNAEFIWLHPRRHGSPFGRGPDNLPVVFLSHTYRHLECRFIHLPLYKIIRERYAVYWKVRPKSV